MPVAGCSSFPPWPGKKKNQNLCRWREIVLRGKHLIFFRAFITVLLGYSAAVPPELEPCIHLSISHIDWIYRVVLGKRLQKGLMFNRTLLCRMYLWGEWDFFALFQSLPGFTNSQLRLWVLVVVRWKQRRGQTIMFLPQVSQMIMIYYWMKAKWLPDIKRKITPPWTPLHLQRPKDNGDNCCCIVEKSRHCQ